MSEAQQIAAERARQAQQRRLAEATQQELNQREAARRIQERKRVSLISEPPKTTTKTTTKPTTKPIPPRQRNVKTFDVVIQDLFDKSNFPSQETVKQAYLDAGPSQIDSVRFLPENVGEGLYRLAYGVTETLGGGIREATFGLSGSLGVENRPGGQIIQVVGALATPTAADFIAGYVLSRLGVTKIGRRILKKIDMALESGDDFIPRLTAAEIDEVKQFEKLGGGLTDLRRTAKRNPELFRTIEEIAEHYKKTPSDFTAGASVIPEELTLFRDLSYDLDLDTGELINFIKKNDDLFLDGSLLASIIPSLSNKDAEKILQETTNIPKEDIINIIEQLRKAAPRQVLGETPIQEQIPEDDQIQGEPQIQEMGVREPTIIKQTKQITESVATEQLAEVIVSTPIILTPKKREQRNTLNLRLFRGAKTMFRVSFIYSTSKQEIVNVEARSFPEAVNKATRRRKPSKKQPKLVDVVKLN